MDDASSNSQDLAMTVAYQGPGSNASYGRLVVDVEKCVACRCCEYVCSTKHYGECNPARSRIFVVRSVVDGTIASVPVVCQQCEDPLCVAMCPASALVRDEETHAVVVVDKDRCLGCRTCVEVCPFGAPAVDPRTGITEKCDLCGGDPMCVKVCTFDAIKYLPAAEESIHLKRAQVQRYLDHVLQGREAP
jgi:anaerobic carbon-monoxide dehydrogenase iron sulfur subunit